MTNWIFYGVPVLSVLLVVVFIFYIHNNKKSKSKPNEQIHPDSINFLYILVIGVALGFSSTGMWLSFDFALFFGGGNLNWTVAVVIFFLTSEVATIAGATGISYGANLGRARIVYVSLLLLVGGFLCNSLVNQFSISQKVDIIETERRVQSDEYQRGLAQREAAETAAQNAYVSNAQHETAVNTQESLKQAKQAWLAEPAFNSQGIKIGDNQFAIDNFSQSCTSKFYGGLCAKRDAFDQKIAAQQEIINGYNSYSSKREYANNLNSQPLAAAVTDSAMPGYQVLSKILGADIDDVRANANQMLGLWLQIAGLLAWALFGMLKAEKDRLRARFSIANAQSNAPPLGLNNASDAVLAYSQPSVSPETTKRRTHQKKSGSFTKPCIGMDENGNEVDKNVATWLQVFRYLMVTEKICATHANTMLETNASYANKYGKPIWEEINRSKWGDDVKDAVLADTKRHLS